MKSLKYDEDDVSDDAQHSALLKPSEKKVGIDSNRKECTIHPQTAKHMEE